MSQAQHTVIAEGNLYSLGYLAQALGQTPRVILAAASALSIRPLAIDDIPYFNNTQSGQIQTFVAEHRFHDKDPDGAINVGEEAAVGVKN